MINQNRNISLDILRILCSAAVVLIHVSGTYMVYTDTHSIDFHIFNIFNSISRCSVPIFFMISGSFFLSKDIPINEMITKYIKRLFIVFYAWSFIYGLYLLIVGIDIKTIIFTCLFGYYHMWFLLSIIGLYFLTPVIRKIVVDRVVTKYLCILLFIFCVVFPYIFTLSSALSIRLDELNSFISNFRISNISSYFLYYILGYHISHDISKKIKKVYAIIGTLIGFSLTIILTSIISYNAGMLVETFYDYYTFNIFISSISIFALFNSLEMNTTKEKEIINMSKYTLCIYLVHPLVLAKVYSYTYNISSSLLLNFIITLLLVYIISLIIAIILKRLSITKKIV